MKCKNCGNELQPGWSKCPFCGTSIEKKLVCSHCGNELQPGWSRCPICGQKVGSSNSLGDILPSDDGLDLVAGDIAEAKQRMKQEENEAYQKKLTLARVACIRKNYQQAQTIYEDLLAENEEDVNAYIGFIRIASQNYSVLEGAEIDEAIKVAKQVTGKNDLTKCDKDFADYSAKRKAHFEAIAEAERKAKLEAERKAKEEAERKAKEEAERKAKEEAERKAKAEAERKAKLEAERKAKEEAERKAKEEAERKRLEAERKVREEEERKAKEEQARLAKIEAERKAKEEEARKRKAENARKAREAAAKKRQEEEQKLAEEREREYTYSKIKLKMNDSRSFGSCGDTEKEYTLLQEVVEGCTKLGNYKDCNYYKSQAMTRMNQIYGKVKRIRNRRSKKVSAELKRPTIIVYVVELILILVDIFILASAHRSGIGKAFFIIPIDIVAHIILRKTVVDKESPNTTGAFWLTAVLFLVYVITVVCAVPPVGHTDVLFDHSQSGGINVLWNVLITIAEVIVLGIVKLCSAAIGLDVKDN